MYVEFSFNIHIISSSFGEIKDSIPDTKLKPSNGKRFNWPFAVILKCTLVGRGDIWGLSFKNTMQLSQRSQNIGPLSRLVKGDIV